METDTKLITKLCHRVKPTKNLLSNKNYWYLWTSWGIGWPNAYPVLSSTTSI